MFKLTSRSRARTGILLSLMTPLWGLFAVLTKIVKQVPSKSAVMLLLGAVMAVGQLHSAQAAQSSYLNFQARLLTNAGAVVADGYYHVEFKLYNVSSGGTALWTETWSSNDNSNRLRVVNGYLTVNLGADTAFPNNIAWDQQLWLTMNIGGRNSSASWDGEMNPRILLTALPYAFKSAETLQVKKVDGVNTGTLSFNTVANNPAIVLPDASGTVCLQGSASCGFVSGSSNNFIQNGTSVQTANFNIQSAASGSIGAVIAGANGQSVDILQVRADGVTAPILSVNNSSASVNGVFKVINSDGTTGVEIRSGGSALRNTLVGLNSGSAITTGQDNTSLGTSSLQVNITGSGNVALGTFALQNNTASDNTAVGSYSLRENTTGSHNTSLGTTALQFNTGGSYNTAIGRGSLLNTTGNANTAVGYLSGANTTGTDNTAIGNQALLSNTTGNKNTALGMFAGYTDQIDTGFATLSNLQNATMVGYNAQAHASNSLILGGAGSSAVNVGIGTTAPTDLFSVSPVYYSTGTASQSGNAVSGTGTTWGPEVVGMELIFANGSKGTITARGSNTSLTLSSSATNSSQAYRIHNRNFYVTNSGSAAFRSSTNSTTAFQIQNAAGNSNLFIADTVNNRIGIGTDAPAVQLHLRGSTDTSARIALDSSATGGNRWDLISATNTLHGVTNGDLLFWNNNQNAVRATLSAAGIFSTFGLVAPSLQTASGALTLDTGSAAAINIGASGGSPTANAINLNVNTTVASGRTLSVAGGVTTLTANGSSNGNALVVSNSTGSGNILQLQDGSGTAATVFLVADEGATTLTPKSTYTGTGMSINQAGNPTTGNALLRLNNTNATPSGTLLDLQAASSSVLSVDTTGSIAFGQTGNATSAIKKRMNVNGTIAANDVVVMHTSAGTVTRTTTAENTRVFGVATGTGTPQDIVIGGVYQVNLDDTTANVAIGDFIVTSTQAGAVTKSANPPTGAVLGRALSATGSASSGQTIWVYITPGTGGSTDSLQSAYNNSTSPEIVLNNTNHGISIQNSSGGVTGNLFEVQSNGGGTTYLGVSSTQISVTGQLSQTAGNLLAGTNGYTQTLTNASTSGGIVNGMSQTITVSNTTSASTTNGINLSITDNTSLSNSNTGINVSLAGSNANQEQIGISSSVNRGIALKATSSGGMTTTNCGSYASSSWAVGVCGEASGSNSTGILGRSSSTTLLGFGVNGAGTVGVNSTNTTSGTFITGVAGIINLNSGTAGSSTGVYGAGRGGAGSTAYGGYFTLSGSSATAGASLYATNASTSSNILQLQDNTTDVMTVADSGLVTISPVSSATGSALTITQAGNPTSGNALIRANNTNGAPSGSLMDLQTGGSSRYSVDTSGNSSQSGNATVSGNISTAGQLIFSNTGNSASTIRKSMIVTSAVTANDVVIFDVANAGQVTTTNTPDSSRVFGVASATNLSGIAQNIVTSGVFQVRIVAADSTPNNEVNVGDFLTTTTTTGRVKVNNAAASGTSIGRALSGEDASGYVWVFVSPGSGGAPTSLQQAYNLSTGTDITLVSAGSGGLQIDAGDITAGNALFEVQSAGGATKYLSVNSNGISVAGTATVSTSVQTPLLTTVTGALTLDTGSAAAINIGASGGSPTANAINLNVNTTVASGRTLSVAGGVTTLTANGSSNGNALVVSNSTGSGNILQLQDGSGTAATVFLVADEGATTLTPKSTYTGTGMSINQAGNPTTGNALLRLNNTNATPSGTLLSFQTNGTENASVDVSGNFNTSGQLIFSGTGNTAATVRKNMIVSTAVEANDIVIINTSSAGRVTTTTTADSTQVFGIATSTQAGTNTAQDIVTGGVFQVNIIASDTVNVGDFITTSSTAGKGKVNNAAPAGTVIGRALSAKDGSNKAWIYVTPGAGGSPTNLQQAYNLSTGTDITLSSSGSGAVQIDAGDITAGNALFEVQSAGGGTKYLTVNSNGISVVGTATVSTSVQTPLLTTGSGNLSLQPATGIVTLNRASTANELRVYENSATPNNYISLRHGSLTTSSGALTFDTGSAAAINIGTSGSPTTNVINLNQNTSVASGRTLTVVGGVTTLTADGGSNGEGLVVSNSTGNGNIARFVDGSGAGTDVLTIANSGHTTLRNVSNSASALQIQNAIGSNVIAVDTTSLNSFITNGSFESSTITAWTSKGTGTVTRDVTNGAYHGGASLQVAATNSGNGAKYDISLNNGTTYALSFYVKMISGTTLSASNFEAGWNNGSTDTGCSLSPSLSTAAPVGSGWTRYSCTFTGSSSGHIYWKLTSSVSSTFNIDAVQLEQSSTATAYKESGISLNGLVNSAVNIKNSNNSTVALQVQNSSGTNVFNVDTVNNAVYAQALSTTTLNASSTITGSNFVYTDGSTAQKRYNFTRTLPDSANVYVDIGSFAITHGAHMLDISATVNVAGFSTAKRYTLALKYDQTGGNWRDVLPTYDGGAFGSENFVMETRITNDTAYLRLRRTGGSVTGAVVNLNILQLGSDSDVFTPSSVVGVTASNSIFAGTPMVQDSGSGRVGIQNAAPAYTLDVTGTINASVALQAPVVSTASGGLAIQPANGQVSINTNGQTNELRVFDNAQTNYTYVRHGAIGTSNASALTIDTGGAAAVNIGTTNANAISLGANTTVANTRTFTVTGGLTTLNANAAINGDALRVVKTGTGNVAAFLDGSVSVFSLTNGGIATFRNTSDSATAFQIQDANANVTMAVDNVTGHLKIYENTTGPTRYADIYYDSATTTAHYTASTGTVAVGSGAGAITINAGSGAAVNITGNASSLWQTTGTSSTLTLQTTGGSADLVFGSGSGRINVNGSSVLRLGISTGDPGTCTAGAIVYNNTTSKLRGCEGSTWRNLAGTAQDAYTYSVGGTTPEVKVDSTRGSFDIQDANTTIGADLLSVRASNASGLGTTLLGVDSYGNTLLQTNTSITLFRANASNTRVEIGSPTPHATNPIILVLDNYNNATEPTGTNGAIYYNANSHKFRCYQNGSWKDCMSGFNTVAKTSDQAATQNSTTFQNDSNLQFSVAANTSYIIEAWIPINNGDTTADFKYTFTTPAGATLNIMTQRYNSTVANVVCNITTSGQTCADTSDVANMFIKIEGFIVTGGTAGTVNFQFAQNTATAVSFPTVRAGATLSWRPAN